MYCIRSFNETQSARGQRPAVCWNQSVLQLQGSRSAAQTTKERWEALLRYATQVITLPKFLSMLFQAVIGVKGTECYINFFFCKRMTRSVSLCRWWSSTASHVRQPCVWSAQRANTGSTWLFLCGMWWNSTRLRWRHSWMPYTAGGGLDTSGKL